MTSVALNNLWNYLQGLQLSQKNRQWLADKLTETKSATKTNELDLALDDIKQGRILTYNSLDELINDI